MQIFNNGFLKNFSTAEEQKPKFKPRLRQIDSERHAKWGCSTPNMKRDILKISDREWWKYWNRL